MYFYFTITYYLLLLLLIRLIAYSKCRRTHAAIIRKHTAGIHLGLLFAIVTFYVCRWLWTLHIMMQMDKLNVPAMMHPGRPLPDIAMHPGRPLPDIAMHPGRPLPDIAMHPGRPLPDIAMFFLQIGQRCHMVYPKW
jgi:hypothetical protein